MFNNNPLLAALYQMHSQSQQPQIRNQGQQMPPDPFAQMNSTEGAAPQQPMLQMPGGPSSGPQSVPYHWFPQMR